MKVNKSSNDLYLALWEQQSIVDDLGLQKDLVKLALTKMPIFRCMILMKLQRFHCKYRELVENE